MQQLIAGIRQLDDRLGPEDAPVMHRALHRHPDPRAAPTTGRRRRPADRGVRAHGRGEHDPAPLPARPEAGDAGRDRRRGGRLPGPPVAVRRALHAQPRAGARAGRRRTSSSTRSPPSSRSSTSGLGGGLRPPARPRSSAPRTSRSPPRATFPAGPAVIVSGRGRRARCWRTGPSLEEIEAAIDRPRRAEPRLLEYSVAPRGVAQPGSAHRSGR